jgi:hypothetical protein
VERSGQIFICTHCQTLCAAKFLASAVWYAERSATRF